MNFRQVQKKINAISNVKKITNAMQMVAGVRMKKAQKLALEGRIYREALERIIKKALSKLDSEFSLLLSKRKQIKDGRDLYIVISSNKGLCGSFNYYLLNFLSKNSNFEKDDFLVVGKKAADFLSRIKSNIIADFSDQLPFIDNVSPVFELVLNKYIQDNYKSIYVVYNKFISTSRFETVKSKLLPFESLEKYEEKENIVEKQYLVEPSPEEIVDSVLKDLVKEKIKTAILDSEAAEYSARMLAMKNATDSASEIIDTLTLEGNKLRQTSITNELLDMISALQSSS